MATTSEVLQHEFVNVNGIRMHYVTMGNGPLIVFLHGFPEFWYSWRHQIPFFSKHFKVVVPDMRGYGETEKPAEINEYRIEKLIVMNMPHLAVFQKNAFRNYEQMQKSWYMFFFLLQDVPENRLSSNDFEFLKHLFEISIKRKEKSK